MEEQRRFPRYVIPENAVVVDEQEQELGRVFEAGGGGMLIRTASEAAARALEQRGRMRVVVVEPGQDNRHTFEVAVKYRNGISVGVEFSPE